MPEPKKILIRHPKEKLKKCSLSTLHHREDCEFHKAKDGFSYDATNCIVLEIGAPLISNADKGLPLVMLDSTWVLLPKLKAKLKGDFILRSLPSNIKTAYPRMSKMHEDPHNGLATIEALFAALKLSEQEDSSILDGYAYAEDFKAKNAFLWEKEDA